MDKSREQFEAWFHDRYDSISMKPVERVLLSANQWASWQASRAAVRIELPDLAVDKDSRLAAEIWPEQGFNLAIIWVRRALKAAGLKVKGE
ncbi:hypothetical protein G9G39_06240 [Cronobacter sp. EKM101R]|uniref:hypothetical protein n=1 Tax=unclassified Cronobacter TaxID=2649764 RepID=UPI0013ECB22D|nr:MULTISPECIES: hypothetical protein [unclassified Cronobacter]KAF6596660.1 hypothetical protein G9G39_06240 [Cronobacter sp. EKM101R]KAF6599486.1 hypothetical protein G9G38_05875 [Cronobacter sp. EKM102R]